MNDAQAKSRQGGDAADPATGEAAPSEASADAAADGGDGDNMDKDVLNIGEHDDGNTERGGGGGANPGTKDGLGPEADKEEGIYEERPEEVRERGASKTARVVTVLGSGSHLQGAREPKRSGTM